MVHRPETDTTPAEEARAFFALLGAEGGQCVRTRLSEVLQALDETGSYTMTPDELRFAITRAWRNSPRCIGRRYWRGMTWVWRARRAAPSPTKAPSSVISASTIATTSSA